MKVYLLKPNLTGATDLKSDEFVKYVCEELEEYITVQRINSENTVKSIRQEIDGDSLIVFFNGKNGKLSNEVNKFMENAIRNGAKMFPIAMEKDARLPAAVVKKYHKRCLNCCKGVIKREGTDFLYWNGYR